MNNCTAMLPFARHLFLALVFLIAGLPIAGAQDAVDRLRNPEEPRPEEVVEAAEEAAAEPALEQTEPVVKPDGEFHSVYVIPIKDAISKPNQYILRRGLKDAIANNIDTVVLDIDTPGGRGDVMLDIMERLFDFEGHTLAFVNDEAMSAGAFISFSADEIWYHPRGVIGSAAVIAGSGQEIPETLKQKIDAYISAKARSMADDHPYKVQVMEAMMNSEYELVIDGKVISPEGKLLALTADEAMTRYGRPPTPLFGEGIATDIDDLLNQRFGEGNYEVKTFTITWSEEVAKYMDTIAPILVGLGFLLLFVEFKTPGFGIFGLSGLALLAVVFLSNYVAGLAGYEPLLFFVAGVLLVVIELFVFPGTLVFLVSGIGLMVGSLLWSMADLWPKEGGTIEIDPEAFIEPMWDFTISMVITAIGVVILWKFLPKTPIYKNVVLQTSNAKVSDVIAHGGSSGSAKLPDVGANGVAANTLRPTGQVDIDGQRFEASAEFGTIEKGRSVIVTGYRNFYLLVAEPETKS